MRSDGGGGASLLVFNELRMREPSSFYHYANMSVETFVIKSKKIHRIITATCKVGWGIVAVHILVNSK